MFNKILKKFSFRVVTNFYYISIIFFLCACFFFLESAFNLVSVAESSPNLAELENKNNLSIRDTFDLGMLHESFSAPRAEFFDKDNIAYSLKNYRKKLTILYLWASWCMECYNDLITLEQLKEELRYKDIEDIVILVVTIDFKPLEQLALLLKQRGITGIQLFCDPKKSLMGELGVHSLPSVFIINPQGDVIAKYKQPLDWSHKVVLEKLMALRQQYNLTSDPSEKTHTQDLKEGDKTQHQDIIPKTAPPRTTKQPTFIG